MFRRYNYLDWAALMRLHFLAAAILWATPSSAHHVETKASASKILDRYQKIEAGIACTNRPIKKYRSIDDRHLIFEAKGGVDFLGELDGEKRCQGLHKYRAFIVEADDDGRYCVGAVVSISRSSSVSIGSAGNGPGNARIDSSGGGTLPSCEITGLFEVRRADETDTE